MPLLLSLTPRLWHRGMLAVIHQRIPILTRMLPPSDNW